MIACTSPSATDRSMPFRISRPSSSRACRFLISSITQNRFKSVARPLCVLPADYTSADTAFEAHRQQLLRLDGELHRQLLQDFLAKSVDDQRQRILVLDAALAAIEQLVLADLRGRRL